MRETDLDTSSLPVYAALASGVRLRMLQILASEPANQRQLAERLGISSAMAGQHLTKLERAGLVTVERVLTVRGAEKRVGLRESSLRADLTRPLVSPPRTAEVSVPIGHYVDFTVTPPCGLATAGGMIGELDDPRYFFDPQRVDAGILWLTEGRITYRVPVFHPDGTTPEAVVVSMEIGAEAPGFAMEWPSTIHLRLNGRWVGTFDVPGDFGDRPGRLAPAYWQAMRVNQYGVRRVLRVGAGGTTVDGGAVSDVALGDIGLTGDFLTLELACESRQGSGGGLTLYGREFGDAPQDIVVRYEGGETPG